ncbi:MAG: tRNA lysidine(34) synthetase TilS [Lachnospiraceae bacterium]
MEEIGEMMEDRVFAWIRKYHMIRPGDRVVAGISGGADSVCLLYILLEYKKQVAFDIAVVHVNHGLRGEEAFRDQQFVEEICKREGLAFFPYVYDVESYARKAHLSEEEAGRALRYQAFADCRKRWNGTKTALAHHQGDQAETVLYHLFRGSGLTGLCGMRPVRDTIIRPLLCMNREEIEQYLQDRNLHFVTDSTNTQLRYARNKIRHKILAYAREELNSGAVEHICHAAADILEAEEYLNAQAEALYQQYVQKTEAGYELDLELFLSPMLLVKRVFRLCLESLGELKDVTREHLERICQLEKKEVGKEIMLPGGILVQRGYHKIRFMRTGATWKEVGKYFTKDQVVTEIFSYKRQRIPEKTYTKWFDYDRIYNSLTIRTRQPGDYLTVTAAGGKKKLKDYLIDCKVPKEERDSLLLVADGSHILWVVGYRISEYYKITEETKQVLEVRIVGGNIHE